MTRGEAIGFLVVIAFFTLLALTLAWVPFFGTPHGESQFAGEVVNVEDDRGVVFSTILVEIKSAAESDEPDRFCVYEEDEDELLPQLEEAMGTGDRVTVTHERGFHEPPWDCPAETSVITGVEEVSGR